MPIAEFIALYAFFLLQIFLTAFAAFLLIRIFHKSAEAIEKIILASLYFVSVIIVLMTFLGILRMLNFGALLATLALLCVALGFIAIKKKSLADQSTAQKINFKILLIFAPLALILIIKFVNATLSQITETDSLVYHLPFAVQWYQTQSIWEPYYTAYAGPLGYYPGNYELLSLFMFLPFKNDILINLVNFALFIPFGLILFKIGQLFGLKKFPAAVATTLFLFTPLIIRQAGIPQNDLFFVFTLGVACYFGLKRDIIPFSLGLGLFIGTKSSGIVYGALVLLIVAVILRKKPLRIIVMMAIVFAVGGFWYLRNWIYTGNPLFPMEISIAGLTLFKGFASFIERLRDSSLVAHLDFATFREVIKNTFLSTGILGAIGIFAWMRGWFSKKVPRIFLIAVPVFLGLYIITPFSFANVYPNIRYLLPFFLLGYILFCMTWKGKGSLLIYALTLGNFFIIAWQEYFLPYINDRVFIDVWKIFTHPYLFVLAAGILLFILRPKIWNGLISCLFLGILLILAIPLREANRFTSYAPHGQYIYNEKILEAFEFVEKNLAQDASIAFTRSPAHYPMFGKNWERRIHYINVNECFDCLYDDYSDSPKSILRDANYDNWISNLDRAKKDYLFIGQKMFEKIPPFELDWANSHPEKFQLLFENNYSFLFKIGSSTIVEYDKSNSN